MRRFSARTGSDLESKLSSGRVRSDNPGYDTANPYRLIVALMNLNCDGDRSPLR